MLNANECFGWQHRIFISHFITPYASFTAMYTMRVKCTGGWALVLVSMVGTLSWAWTGTSLI